MTGFRESLPETCSLTVILTLAKLVPRSPGQPPPGGGGGGGGSGDTTPPAWAAGYPKTADPSPDGFRLLFTANENGTAYYVVLADGAAAPSVSEVKNGTGNGGAVAIGSGNTALEANTEASVNVSGLNADTSYDIYVVAEDNVGNLQSSPVKLDVKTTSSTPGDTTPPTLISAAVNGSILELTFDEKLDASSQPAGSDFIVSVQSMQVNVSDVSISNNQVIITLAEPVKPGDNVTVSYTPGTNPIRDEAGNNATTFSDLPVTNNAGVLVAPPLDPTVATTIFNSTAFLYTGSNAVQTGMAPDTIEEKRAAVIRGRVLNRDNTPLPEVRITINHPEFGSTLSRSDGYFDMAVNGGGVLTVRYEKDGYITAQRQVDVPWQDFALLPDVVLINYDSTATPVTLGSSTMQVVRGSQITDKDGTNRRR